MQKFIKPYIIQNKLESLYKQPLSGESSLDLALPENLGSFIFLVQVSLPALPCHLLADPDPQVNVRRHRKSECPSHRSEVQGLDIKDGLQRVRLVSPYIRLERFLGAQVKEVVLRYELLKLQQGHENTMSIRSG